MTKTSLLFPCAVLIWLFLPAGSSYASSLTVETDYRLRGVSFGNNDFDTATSSDTQSYYTQRVQVTIGGSFNGGIRIVTKLTALGVVGSTATFFSTPYPNTSLTPFVENAYVILKDFNDAPIDIYAGKQPLVYGDGLIISDNGLGANALRVVGRIAWPGPWVAELMTAKLATQFKPGSDTDIYGFVSTTEWKKHQWELGYFQYVNKSGYLYAPVGGTPDIARKAVKEYYDIRVGRRDGQSFYQLELAKQTGRITRADDSAVGLNGMGYTIRGELYGKNTRLGTVTARTFLSKASGNDPSHSDSDGSFSPDLTRRYDGLERAGHGQLFAATPSDSYFILPADYSGINTLSLGADFSPLYAWKFAVDYFLYSASVGPRGAPAASGFERLFGAEYSLGVEMDIGVTYTHSKYVSTSLYYNRYTPPQFETFWPHAQSATRYQFEISARF